MGKKQHQKDKLYLTTTEWKNHYGGYKGTQNAGSAAKFRRLPFDCCSLSMQPFEHPLCTKEGFVYDLMNIVPFLKKYGINPTTGEKMTAKDLIKLHFHKNAEGKYHCPVTYKVLNENSHIVAVKVTGNVFSYDAVERLNLKAKFMRDLLTDEPFTRKDLITIQDPTNLDKFNISSFYHVKNNLKVEDDEDAKKNPKYNLKTINSETRDILNELDRDYKTPEYLMKTDDKGRKADKISAAHYSTGAVAASFTSTAATPQTEHEAAAIDEDLLRYERVKKKAYVRIVTSHGQLNLELFSDMVPKTCENFLKHCASGYYNNTIFHRSIRNFMIQGGDPTGTGKGGESAWGGTFKDETKPNLTHSGRGILSMANSGPNTNKSQFFITFRSCTHLDGKHAVFGKVVGGLDTLDKMEQVETGKDDKPKEEIKIIQTTIFVNPYEEADEQLQKERDESEQKDQEEREKEKRKAVRKEQEKGPKLYKSGVGKYINPAAVKRSDDADSGPVPEKRAKTKASGSYSLSDFSSW
ncbi:LOW QUALITY PROTEIN: RING-type E3 ubiquitin-protein ligase PPIL2-like [Liolophura sinensis]|uniref:LOW QUALITY PROTEIN: RING-type E3 ubiquitin-protein ligase PPIL2-like n=1 Tax=Liolophura sinensis TaxID=3198878 RepID=UPI003158B6B9